MSKIVLSLPPQDSDQTGIVSSNEICEPISVGYVKAYSKQRGLNVEVIKSFHSIDDLLIENPEIVGFTVLGSNYGTTKKICEEIKQKNPKTKIVWGGPQATNYHYEGLITGNVDFVVLGEGENTFYELAKRIFNNEKVDDVEGLAFVKKSGTIQRNPKPKRLTSEEIDSIDFRLIHPEGDYHSFSLKYLPHSVPYSEMKFSQIVGSRGCWNDCSFCSSKSMWDRKITYRNPENIVDELEFLVNERNVNFIFFTDDDFLINQKRAVTIAEKIIWRGIRINYHVMASIRSASQFENMGLLKKSGLAEISLGMETTNQETINIIGKGYDLQMLSDVTNNIHNNKIHIGLYYMLGFSNQTKEELEHDYQTIKELPFSRIRAVFITPYPGTRLYNEVEEKDLWLPEHRNNWSSLNCDTPVLKTIASKNEIINARKKVLSLYFTPEYDARMRKIFDGDKRSEQAYNEFKRHIKEALI